MTALVLLPKSRYRDIAQQNWRLTDEQLKGMHVHHRIPRSKGGTDAPENLYVCSPWFHAEVWHDGRYRRIITASSAAVSGGLTANALHKQRGTWNHDPEFHRRVAALRHTVFRESEVQKVLGKRGAEKCKELGVNACFDKSLHEKMRDPILDRDRRQKIRDKISCDWEVITPQGEVLLINNMSAYCKENNLSASKMTGVAKGDRKHHKGFKCKKL